MTVFRPVQRAYGETYQREHAAQLAAEAAEEARLEREKADASARWRATRAGDEAERERLRAAEEDERLQPLKLAKMRAWLVDHPDRSERDFETQAWPHLRVDALADERASAIEREVAAQRARHY